MLKLLSFLWSGCWHEWSTIETGLVVDRPGDLPSGRWWQQECAKCGQRRYRQS